MKTRLFLHTVLSLCTTKGFYFLGGFKTVSCHHIHSFMTFLHCEERWAMPEISTAKEQERHRTRREIDCKKKKKICHRNHRVTETTGTTNTTISCHDHPVASDSRYHHLNHFCNQLSYIHTQTPPHTHTHITHT